MLAAFTQCLSNIGECAGKAVGQYPSCDDCTMFIKCSEDPTTHAAFTCPYSLFYDVSLGVCNYRGQAVCG